MMMDDTIRTLQTRMRGFVRIHNNHLGMAQLRINFGFGIPLAVEIE